MAFSRPISRDAADPDHDYDFVIVGSGFGGSVSALRLAEKGYRVLRPREGASAGGRRISRRPTGRCAKFLWMPALFCYGIQRLTLLPRRRWCSRARGSAAARWSTPTRTSSPRTASSGARPGASWTDWKRGARPALPDRAPHARRQRQPPTSAAGDRVLQDFAGDHRQARTPSARDGGRLSSASGRPAGAGPLLWRRGAGPHRCTYCGGCMVGCRHGAKNTLDKNYLWFAERLGAEVRPETLVTGLEEDGRGRLAVVHPRLHPQDLPRPADDPDARRRPRRRRAGHDRPPPQMPGRGPAPRLSPVLGGYVRTNSEVICGAISRSGEADYSKGIAIASSIHPDPDTCIEVVRYPKGSDVMSFLGTLLVDDGTRLTRPMKWLATCVRHPVDFLRTLSPSAGRSARRSCW